MKTYEILTRVVVHDEAAMLHAAREQFERTDGDRDDIRSTADALEELSHLSEVRLNASDWPLLGAPLDCGVEILQRHVREVEPTTDEPKPYIGNCEHCGAARISLHVWQPEGGGEDFVCRACLAKLDRSPPPPLFPPEVAQAHAAELRSCLADLLNWGATTGCWTSKAWREARALMERIRDEEDAARETGR